jgi:DNA-directed RNA polymerase specialized sigma24 family protein
MIDREPEVESRTGRTPSGWRRLSSEAFRIAAATRLVDRSASEDVAQEAMLTFCRLHYAPRSPIAWLRVTIRRLVLRRVARTRLEQRALERYFAETRPRRLSSSSRARALELFPGV